MQLMWSRYGIPTKKGIDSYDNQCVVINTTGKKGIVIEGKMFHIREIDADDYWGCFSYEELYQSELTACYPNEIPYFMDDNYTIINHDIHRNFLIEIKKAYKCSHSLIVDFGMLFDDEKELDGSWDIIMKAYEEYFY